MELDYVDNAFATPLVRAVLSNDQSMVQEALERGFNANLPDNRGWTPVHSAAVSDSRIDCLKTLLSHHSANINSRTFLGETALLLACQNGCLKTVELLLNQPTCDVNSMNCKGVSPLHVACNKVNIEMTKLLINYGANINCKDFNGYTPLHDALHGSSGGEDDIGLIVSCLLNHKANPDLEELEGNCPIHFACLNGLIKCTKLLIKASKHCNIVNRRNDDGRSPFMMAVHTGNVALLEYLLSQGADPNVADNFHVVALQLAAHTANFEVFSLVQNATSEECITKYCTFDEERDFKHICKFKRINSLICLTIDTEDLQFLTQVLESGVNSDALQCPVVHSENAVAKSFTLHTPISFLLETKMCDLAERTVDFLTTLITHRIPLVKTSNIHSISYVDPICAALVALNDCPKQIVLKCLRVLLKSGADPDYPHGRMSYAIEQACMRSCKEAVLLLLQFSNVIEPEDVLKWIEQETSSNQDQIVEALLPLAPYYVPSSGLLPDLVDVPRRMNLLAHRVYPLSNYCRSVVRKQLREESQSNPSLFQRKLSDLCLPKELYNFLCYV